MTVPIADVEAVSIGEYRSRGMDGDRARRWNRRLEDYRKARADGIRPRSTTRSDIDAARAISDVTQQPFDARFASA